MFLSELYRFKKRQEQAPRSGMAPEGFSEENIGFVLRLTPEGELADCLSLMSDKGKPRRMQVPAAVKRTVGVAPNFLWDNTGYVLGADGKGKAERTARTFEAFRQRHRLAAETTGNRRIRAVAAFLENWNPERFPELADHDAMLDRNIVFQIVGEKDFIHNMPDVRAAWETLRSADSHPQGVCLVTGRYGPIKKVHSGIKGIGPKAESALISFNCPAFESYGKTQSLNAPVSAEAAEAYTTALNYLLRRENRHSTSVGDTTALFWAEKAAPVEEAALYAVMTITDAEADEPETGEDAAALHRVSDTLAALRQGIPARNLEGFDPEVRFFLLGLAPNQARLAVRFWLTATFGELADNVGRFYRDLAVERAYPTQPEFPALWQLLREVAVQGKGANVPPVLEGALARSVFSGTPYPEALYAAVLARIHADKHVSYLRSALLKAILTRNHSKEFAMSLDTSRKDTPYLLGRLFSLLEKNQQDALGALNASIRDRYIGSASATPRRVFPLLLRLAQHHAAKSEYGHFVQKNIAAVVEDIANFPATLSLEEQGVFFLGYYQQNNANYRKKNPDQE